MRWVEVLRSPASDDPSHPLFLWKASAKDPGAAKKFGQKWEDQAKAFEAALKETELLADFDSGDAEGWTSTGFSFDAAPTKSPEWTPGTDGGLVTPAGVLTSAELPARFHGVLRSPTFELTRNSIHLRLRSRAAEVRLVIDGHYMNRFHQLLLKGTILKTGDTDTKGEFRWLTMTGDVNKYVGHRVYLEISDLSGGFVELDEVRLSDAPLPPEPPILGRFILAHKSGDSRAELANAYGATWADGVTSLQNQKAAPAQAAWLDFVWREQLWPRNPDLEETARAMTRSNPPEPLFATAMLDGTPENERIHIRGSHLKLGDTVPRQNLTALGGSLAPVTASGRLELARELVSKDNPLVRRVAVNRVWHHLFERGIVPTVDDFGVMGQPPSHPELLDWLATEFSDSMNWSLKRLLREIVLSGTYRMSSAPHPSLDRERLAVVDPGNVLLHRAPIRRLQAEAIRDAILTVSGRLDPAVGGPSVPVHLTSFMEGRGRPKESGPLDGAGRRSLYTEIRRNFLPPFLLTFDMPIPFNAMGRRSVSNVPAQALSLLNDPFVVEEAGLWAEHITADASVSMDDRIVRLFQAAYCRRPTDEERQQIESFLASEPDQKQAWSDLCHTLFNKKEFIYLN
ncbi:MAG: DUF1553 domain-containing protein [Verrucomicrobiae bacterium]|nr:DUF1553 domain-containing protein [Verrucomicrobiae bacterium]